MNFFKKLSIRTQVLIIGLIIIATIPLTIFNVYSKSSTMIMDQSRHYNEELAALMKQRISTNYANVSELMIHFGYDATVQSFLVETDNLRIYELAKKIESLMSVLKNTNKDILDIVVVSKSGKYVSLKGLIKYAYDIEARLGKDGIVKYGGFHKADPADTPDNLLFGMNIFSSGETLPYGDKIGFITLVLDVQSINKELAKYPRLAGTTLYLFDDKDLVYSNDEPNDPLIDTISGPMFDSDEGQAVIKTINGKRYTLQSQALPEIRGRIVTATPISNLIQDLNKLKTASYTLFVITLLLVTIPYSVLIMNLLRPLSKLMAFMKRLKSENENLDVLHSRVALEGYAEIEVISNEFNTMLERIRGLTDQLVHTSTQLYQSELEKQRVEFSYLQSQINPHFLSNTLDSIKGIAIVKGNREIYEMAGSLSRMLRYSIKGSDEVSLGEEIQIVKSYLNIHELRFSGRIECTIHCSVELLSIQVPKMIIQPIVENALTHGLEELAQGGRIQISADRNANGELEITVADNGAGIEPDRLEQLREMLQSKDSKLMGHIGIRNVHNRIRLKHGEPYGVTLNSAEGEGTEVILTLPAGNE